MPELARPEEGGRASGRKVFVRTVHFLLRVVGLLEQNDTGVTEMEEPFSHCCFQNTQQKQPEGWEGLHLIQSFRFGSFQQREPGGGCSSVHSKRVQETELGMLGFYWPSAFPLLERNDPHSEWFLSGNSQAHPEMFLTSPPGILDPGMLIISDHHKEAEATD